MQKIYSIKHIKSQLRFLVKWLRSFLADRHGKDYNLNQTFVQDIWVLERQTHSG